MPENTNTTSGSLEQVRRDKRNKNNKGQGEFKLCEWRSDIQEMDVNGALDGQLSNELQRLLHKFDPDKSEQEAPPPSGPTSTEFLVESTRAHVRDGSV